MKKSMLSLSLVLALALFVSLQVAAASLEPQAWPYGTAGTERMPSLFGNTMYLTMEYDVYSSQFENGAWTAPEAVPGAINTFQNELHPIVVGGGKVMYFLRMTPDTNYDFFRSVWDDSKKEWAEPVRVDELSTDTQDWDIWVNDDETVAYVTTKGAYGDQESLGGRDVWKSVKKDGKWSTPVNIGAPVNSDSNEWSIWVDPQGRLYVDSSRDGGVGGYDIWVGESEKGPVTNFALVNSEAAERSVAVSDDLAVFTSQNRDGGQGGYDIFYVVLK